MLTNTEIRETGMKQLILLMSLFAALSGTGAQAVESIRVLGLFTNKAIVEIDGKRRVLTVGQREKSGVKLISADSEQAVIEIDGVRNSYRLGAHTALGTKFETPGPAASVQIYPDIAGMYSINGSIEGFPVRFLVDTGATLVSMNRNEAKRLGLDYKLTGTEGRASTASGVTRAYYLTLKRVKVGDIELRDVAAAVIDSDHPPDVLLGNSFLGRLDMQRDGQIMELRKK
jgi:aspartyl protease family protein